MNGDDRVLGVELAREHRPDFAGLDVAAEAVERLLEVGGDVFALLRPVDEDGEIVRLLAQRGGERAIVFDAAAALLDLLRRGLVLPEVGRGGAQIEVVQFAGKAGFVKAPSAGRRRGWRDPGIA
jgi:hypothetical protein